METLLLCCSNPTNIMLSPPHVIRHVTLSPRQLSYSYSCHQLGAINKNDDKRRRKRVKCIGGVREVKESDFEELVLRSELPVLVEFVANWCGPCRLISPSVLSLSQEYKEKLTIVKIDHDLNPNLIEEFKVYGLPTLILFKNGKVVPESRREGAITKVKLKAYVDSLLESISVA